MSELSGCPWASFRAKVSGIFDVAWAGMPITPRERERLIDQLSSRGPLTGDDLRMSSGGKDHFGEVRR
jgi:hypothetical protein